MAKIVIQKYKNIYNEIVVVAEKYSIAKVFYDFIEMMALEIAIKTGHANLEERFNQTKSQYKEKDLIHYNNFKNFVIEEFLNNRFQDVFGVLFHELELHNNFKGQFFTPYEVSRGIAKMNISESDLKNKDFIFANEPACGSGGMIIAYSQVVEELKYNYAEKLIWVAQDIDLHCVYMCYIQLNLTGVAAIVQHSNSLSVELFESFYTTAFLLNNCKERLESKYRENKTLEIIKEIQKEEKDETKEEKIENKERQFDFNF